MAEVQKADTSIYANLNTQKPMSLADMLNISKSSYELSKLKELYPAMIAEQEAKSKTAQIGANVAEQTQNPTIAKAGAESLKSQLESNNAHFNNIIKNGSDLLTKPNLTKEDIIQRYTEIHKNGPNAGNPVALKQALMGLPEKGSATDYKKFIIANMGKTLESQTQFEKMFPAVSMTDVGGKVVPIAQGNPYVAAIQPGVSTGEGIQKGLPPTTTVVNPQTGREEYIGGGGITKLGPTEIAQSEVASKEIAANQAEYKNAANTVSTLKNIKGLASKAYTGVGSDYKALVTGIANAIGIDAGTLEKTATDELAKNSAVLTLAGGNTDLARQIAEMATPGHKLTEKAIKDISNQLIGVQRMNQARLEYVAPYKDNPKEYNKHLTIFDKYKDFRIFQLADMTPAEIKEYKASMSKEQRDEITKKIKEAEAVGIDIPGVK
jgi:hypothetical protein